MTTTQGEHAQTEALRLADALYDGSYLLSVERYTTANELSRLHARNEALIGGLKKANEQAEHFEREWYLRGDEIEVLHAQVAALTAALGVQTDPVKDEATCQMCGEKPYPGCNSEFQDEAACLFYHPATAQTESLAHELFAAAQLAPGEGIEDAVSRIAAALTAAPSVSDGLRTLHDAILNRLSHAELLEKAHYLMELNSNQARTIGELQDLVEDATAQPAAPQGVAYAELPEHCFVAFERLYSADQMRDFADRTHALRASNGQAPAEWDGKLPTSLQRCLNALRLKCSPELVNGVEHEVRSTFEALHTTLATTKRMYGAARDRLEAVEAAQAAPAAGAVAGPDDLSKTTDEDLMVIAVVGLNSARFRLGKGDCAGALEVVNKARDACIEAGKRASNAAAPTPAAQTETLDADALDRIETALMMAIEPETAEAAIKLLRAQADSQPAPIDMVLHCPACGLQHIDGPDQRLHSLVLPEAQDWNNPPHRSHLCHGCGHIWRPADVPTNGVQAVKTAGKADSHIADSAQADSVLEDAARWQYLRDVREVALCVMFFGNGCTNITVADVIKTIDAKIAARKQGGKHD